MTEENDVIEELAPEVAIEEAPEGDKSGILYLYDEENKRYWIDLPSGKLLELKPVHPLIIRRIFNAYTEPPVPTVDVEGAQRLTKECDPDYLEKMRRWQQDLTVALLTRYVLDAIVVPDNDSWASKLKETGIPIPQAGGDRQWAFVEEAHIELLQDDEDRSVFLRAVRQISMPSPAGQEVARRRFRDEMAGSSLGEPETAPGGNPGGS